MRIVRLFVEKAFFWLKYPFAIVAFKRRQSKQWRRIVPRRWFSPAAVILQDLELYGSENRDRFSLEFIDGFAKSRDTTLAQIKKHLIISSLIFLFLLSNYLAIGLDISIAGFSLRYSPGIPEGLLLIGNLLSCYALILQSNCYILDSTIKSAIAIGVPEELRAVYLVRYFPHEHFGRYQPFNMPYLIPNKLQIALDRSVRWLFVFLLLFTYLAYSLCNLFLLFHHLWFKPHFGNWSHLLLIYILTCGVCAWLFIIMTRFKLPYLDYITNNELELLEQINPPLARTRRQELYGALVDDQLDMKRRGYLK